MAPVIANFGEQKGKKVKVSHENDYLGENWECSQQGPFKAWTSPSFLGMQLLLLHLYQGENCTGRNSCEDIQSYLCPWKVLTWKSRFVGCFSEKPKLEGHWSSLLLFPAFPASWVYVLLAWRKQMRYGVQKKEEQKVAFPRNQTGSGCYQGCLNGRGRDLNYKVKCFGEFSYTGEVLCCARLSWGLCFIIINSPNLF